METETMGRVTTVAKFENSGDLWAVRNGLKAPEQVRELTVDDALVDTGATLLSMPIGMIRRLGLGQIRTRSVRSSTGISEVGMFEAVRLTIMGRDCTMDVLEVPDGTPVLIGQLPLEHLDFVVDLRERKLIGNPAHGGEHIYEMY